MKSVLLLKHLRIQNANAISGLTWGFPAITNFLGFTHALSRFVQGKHEVSLGGCAVVCHQHQVQAHQPGGYGEYIFALTRNPLTKEGKTASFNEEGRMHMDVSLLIECDFTINDIDCDTDDDVQDRQLFEQQLTEKIYSMRLAGGNFLNIGKVEFIALPDMPEERDGRFRCLMFGLLPGFLLVDRSDLLEQHYTQLKEEQPDAQLLDAWLDFSALKYQAHAQPAAGEEITENTPAEWSYVSKPGQGWLVPIMSGYQAISPLYEAGEIAHTRDSETPFRFVESAYSIGQWLSPHRIKKIDQIFWHYHSEAGCYLCRNSYQPQISIFE